jgi:hypothetical protein
VDKILSKFVVFKENNFLKFYGFFQFDQNIQFDKISTGTITQIVFRHEPLQLKTNHGGDNARSPYHKEYVTVKIVRFSIAGICHGQNCQFQYVLNMSWSKLSVSAWLSCVMVQIVSLSIVWNMSWSKSSACLEYVRVKIVRFSMAGCVMVKIVRFNMVEFVTVKNDRFSIDGMCLDPNDQY